MNPNHLNHLKELRRVKQENKKKLIMLLQEAPGEDLQFYAGRLGVTVRTIRNWRSDDEIFNQRVWALRAEGGKIESRAKGGAPANTETDSNFIIFRKKFFKFDTPWFQRQMCERFESAENGSITLVLLPPEHGKTTLTEDHLTFQIVNNPSSLITIVSEGEDMARKMSRRIQRRLEPNGTAEQLVLDHGPFRSPGGNRSSQPWSVDAWTTFAGMMDDSRDFTVAVGGWKSNIAGTRATRLHIDDIQSLKSLDSTQKMFDIFRQDMLSRPGESGITTMNGTRVGEGDIYERIINEFQDDDFFRLIKYPAIVMNEMTGEPEPLWPDLYSMESLERMRKKVGEEAWWRNYMQNPKTSSVKFFSMEGIEKCRNTLRRVDMTWQEQGCKNPDAVITLDPSINGVNVVAAMHFDPKKLVVLDIQEDTGLPRNSAIAAKVEDVIIRIKARGFNPTTLVIEAAAFQKGLMEDESIMELKAKYGLRLVDHQTGVNKYDEDIGIASLASSVESGQIDLAYGDNKSIHIADMLTNQFESWKPIRDPNTGRIKYQRGNRLRQDVLMAIWFGWIQWTSLRNNRPDDELTQAFTMHGLPFTPTRSGLMVPR